MRSSLICSGERIEGYPDATGGADKKKEVKKKPWRNPSHNVLGGITNVTPLSPLEGEATCRGKPP
jgi:hypothetical protein